MSESIRNTITTTLAAEGVSADGVGELVDAVTDALTKREYKFAEEIIDTVSREFRVSKEDVQRRVEQMGMAVRPAPVVEEHPGLDEWERELADDNGEALPSDDAFIGTEKLKKGKKGSGKGLAKRIKALEKLAKDHGLYV